MAHDTSGQVWPVEAVTKPVCGAGEGHAHPRDNLWSCSDALVPVIPGAFEDGQLQRYGGALLQAWANAGQEKREAIHRAMCATPYTSYRDVDAAFEWEANAKRMAGG